MWLMIQETIDGIKVKYITSSSYNELMKYLNKFINVKKYDEYYFVSRDKEIIEFHIHLCDSLD